MNHKKILHNFVVRLPGVFVWLFLLSALLCGCGIKDSAIVLPLEEEMPAGENASEMQNEAGSDGRVESGSSGQVGSGSNGQAKSGSNGRVLGGETGREPGTAQEEPAMPTICVYVCGEVQNPGVVELPEGSRAWDALLACGGFTDDAKEDFVNLAAYIEDGEKIFFPSKEEAESLQQVETMAENGIVDINTAGVAELTTLPGIGESRAQDIISFREKNGAFRSTEDLKKISGIKDSVYEKLCDKVTVGK